MFREARITLQDNMMDVFTKLSEGNPGALSVCMQMFAEGQKIDPDAAMGGLTGLLALDTHGIYGADIWMLYKDVCGEDLTKTIAMLRSVQMGIITEHTLKHAIGNYGAGLNVDATLATLKEKLPAFGA